VTQTRPRPQPLALLTSAWLTCACADPLIDAQSTLLARTPRCEDLKSTTRGDLSDLQGLRGAWSLEVRRCLTGSEAEVPSTSGAWSDITSALFTLDQRDGALSADFEGLNGEALPPATLTLTSLLGEALPSNLSGLCETTRNIPSCLRLLYEDTSLNTRIELWLYLTQATLVSTLLSEKERYTTPYLLKGLVYSALPNSQRVDQIGVFELLPHPTPEVTE
jgi:hypothetical protein